MQRPPNACGSRWAILFKVNENGISKGLWVRSFVKKGGHPRWGPARGVRIISELLRELFHEVHVGEHVGHVVVPVVFVFDGNGAVKTDFAQGGEGLI